MGLVEYTGEQELVWAQMMVTVSEASIWTAKLVVAVVGVSAS